VVERGRTSGTRQETRTGETLRVRNAGCIRSDKNKKAFITMAIWPSGLRRWNQVESDSATSSPKGRGFESHCCQFFPHHGNPILRFSHPWFHPGGGGPLRSSSHKVNCTVVHYTRQQVWPTPAPELGRGWFFYRSSSSPYYLTCLRILFIYHYARHSFCSPSYSS
jgi:hypothetical protein